MRTDNTTVNTYTLKFYPRMSIDINSPIFSIGKLLHVAQNISGSYADSFSIKVDSEYLYENDDLSQVEVITIELSDISEETADSIAGDLCAFMGLQRVEVIRSVSEKHIVIESV